MEGQVKEPKFLRSLVEMGQEKFTGAIRLENEDVIKIIYFQDGQIISASTNDPTESVDEILLRGKKVTREHIQQALVKRKQDETLGDALLSAGFITRKELRWARRHQIVEVLRSATSSTDWHYTVVPDYLSPRSAEGTNFQVEPLLIELVVTDPDRKHVDKRLDGGEVRLRKAPSFEARYPGLGLNQDADRVADLVDGKRTATEIAAQAGGNGFMNLKLLAALRVLGLVEINPKAQEQLEISFQGDATSGLLPGIEPAEPIDIPDWEVESAPGIDLPAVEAGADWPEAEIESEDLEIGPIGEPEPEPGSGPERKLEVSHSPQPESASALGLTVAAAGKTPDGSPDGDDAVPDGESERVPAFEEPEPEQPSLVDEGISEEIEAEGGRGIEEEVERALEWSPPIGEAVEDEAAEASSRDEGIDRTDESWLPSEEQSRAHGVAAAARQGGGGRFRNRWLPMAVVLILLVAVAGGWYWFRGTDEEVADAAVKDAGSEGQSEEESLRASAEEDAPSAAADEPPAETPNPPLEATIPEAESPAPSPATSPVPVPGVTATATSDDPLRAEYDRRAEAYASAAATVPYTVQFEIVCQTSSVTLALDEGGSSVWFVPISYQGRPCFRVFWGRYETETAARAGESEIPSSLRGSRPVVVQPGRVVE